MESREEDPAPAAHVCIHACMFSPRMVARSRRQAVLPSPPLQTHRATRTLADLSTSPTSAFERRTRPTYMVSHQLTRYKAKRHPTAPVRLPTQLQSVPPFHSNSSEVNRHHAHCPCSCSRRFRCLRRAHQVGRLPGSLCRVPCRQRR